MSGVRRVMHLGIAVADLQRSARFYRDALGFEPLSKLRVEGFPTTTMFELAEIELECIFLERDGLRIELMSFPTPGATGDAQLSPWHARGLTHLAIAVEDLDVTRASILEHGGTILEQTSIVNDDPIYRSRVVCASCPDGVRLELLESPVLDPETPLGESLGPDDL